LTGFGCGAALDKTLPQPLFGLLKRPTAARTRPGSELYVTGAGIGENDPICRLHVEKMHL
jgi:hypothetical protein